MHQTDTNLIFKDKGNLFLSGEFKLINVKGMMEIWKQHLVNSKVIIVSSKNYQWMLKVVKEWWESTHIMRIFTQSQSLSP